MCILGQDDAGAGRSDHHRGGYNFGARNDKYDHYAPADYSAGADYNAPADYSPGPNHTDRSAAGADRPADPGD